MENREANIIGVPSNDLKHSRYLCWQTHLDENTLGDDAGNLIQIISIEGMNLSAESLDTLRRELQLRSAAIKLLAGSEFSINVYFSKKRVNTDHLNSSQDLFGFPRILLEEVGANLTSDAYELNWHIAISLAKPASKKLRLIDFFKFKDIQDPAYLKRRVERLHNVTSTFQARLASYNPKLLGLRNSETGVLISEPMSFLKSLSDNKHHEVPFSVTNISERIFTNRVTFPGGKDLGSIKVADQYSYTLTPIEFDQEWTDGAMVALALMPFPVTFNFSGKFIIRADAQSSIERILSTMKELDDHGVRQQKAIEEALDMLVSGDLAFLKSYMSLRAFGDSPEAAKMNAQQLSTTFTEYSGSLLRLNDVQAKSVYLSQFPGNNRYAHRPTDGLHTLNLAAIASLDRLPKGHVSSIWSPTTPIFTTKTIYDTLYHFNLHAPGTDLGHTTIIGQSTGGKTVLMSAISAFVRRFGVKLVYFDYQYGARILIEALGGEYNVINAGENTGWNPFDLPNNKVTRSFVSSLIVQMLEATNLKILPSDFTDIQRAVDWVFELEPEVRRLSVVDQYLPQGDDTRLTEAFKQWIGEGSKAWLFDNPHNPKFAFNSDIYGYDLTSVFEQGEIKSICFKYLSFCLDNFFIDGTPVCIPIDEAFTYIEDEIAGDVIEKWAQTARRNNVALIFATNNAAHISESKRGKKLAIQSPTNIFLASPRAQAKDYAAFDLTTDEIENILSMSVTDRLLAIKQGGEFSILKFNLGRNIQSMNVLSSRKSTSKLLKEIQKEVGEDSTLWLPKFLEQAPSFQTVKD